MQSRIQNYPKESESEETNSKTSKKAKKRSAGAPPSWMEDYIKEQKKINEDRAREFQEFKNDFLTLQREKNDILKSLASHIMQK